MNISRLLKDIIDDKKGKLINSVNKLSQTPLCISIISKKYEVFKYLLGCECDVDVPDDSGKTALQLVDEGSDMYNLLRKHKFQFKELQCAFFDSESISVYETIQEENDFNENLGVIDEVMTDRVDSEIKAVDILDSVYNEKVSFNTAEICESQ